MNWHVLTLFPQMITDGVSHSILSRAVKAGIINVNCVNIRDYAVNKHGQVDDAPYGGGAGMVMMAPPVYDAYRSLNTSARVVYLTPQGKVFNQQMAVEFSALDELVLLCGHYEGLDERVIEKIVTDEVSIGDYVLTGGEPAALVIMDAVSRLIPGVLGKEESHRDESFSGGLLEYPQYTRPPSFIGSDVPEILLSGNHAKIEAWRREEAVKRTKLKRPDLFIKESTQ
jgi:tRNA (guanine37-N1)-methyltransferase